jgi:hypothetical protein
MKRLLDISGRFSATFPELSSSAKAEDPGGHRALSLLDDTPSRIMTAMGMGTGKRFKTAVRLG